MLGCGQRSRVGSSGSTASYALWSVDDEGVSVSVLRLILGFRRSCCGVLEEDVTGETVVDCD